MIGICIIFYRGCVSVYRDKISLPDTMWEVIVMVGLIIGGYITYVKLQEDTNAEDNG